VKGGGLSFELSLFEETGCVRVIAGVGGMGEGLAGFFEFGDFGDGGGCLPYEDFGDGWVEVEAWRFDSMGVCHPVLCEAECQRWMLRAGRMGMLRRHCKAVRECVARANVDMVGRGFIVRILCRGWCYATGDVDNWTKAQNVGDPCKLEHDVITLRVFGASQLCNELHRSSDLLI
jgi:hypothetical protein